jgi:hypothetical protein
MAIILNKNRALLSAKLENNHLNEVDIHSKWKLTLFNVREIPIKPLITKYEGCITWFHYD